MEEELEFTELINVHGQVELKSELKKLKLLAFIFWPNQTPIHIASAAVDDESCLATLLKVLEGSQLLNEAVNAKTKNQRTPLHLASMRGKIVHGVS